MLASSSPRRKELLTQMGIRFSVLSADIDEQRHPGESPRDLVLRLAGTKARVGRQQFLRQSADAGAGPLLVLGADTVVVLAGEVFGKPRDRADARRMLTALGGQVHQVYSAVAITDGERLGTDLSVTDVHFREIGAAEVDRYVASEDGLDKAGAYGVQGRAAIFVEHLAGSYSGVMGLPLALTDQLLRDFGVNCWETA